MARPKADLPPAATLRALADAEGRLAVRVTPGARSESLAIIDGQLHAKVRARPTDGAANRAVIALLAAALEMPPSQLSLLRGDTDRNKLIRIAL